MLQFLDWNSWGPEGGEAHRRVVMIVSFLRIISSSSKFEFILNTYKIVRRPISTTGNQCAKKLEAKNLFFGV